MTSPKKQTDEFVFLSGWLGNTWNFKWKFKFQVFPSRQDRKKNRSFVCFLGEVTAQQFCFEIYWPLWTDCCESCFCALACYKYRLVRQAHYKLIVPHFKLGCAKKGQSLSPLQPSKYTLVLFGTSKWKHHSFILIAVRCSCHSTKASNANKHFIHLSSLASLVQCTTFIEKLSCFIEEQYNK